MDAILAEKISLKPHQSAGCRDSSSFIQDPLISPRVRYGIGMNEITTRNISSARANRVANPLQSITNSIGISKISVNQPQLPASSNIIADSNNDKNEENQARGAKHQPKMPNKTHLPSVFLTERAQPVKLKKFVKVPQLDENSLEQENPIIEPVLQPKANPKQKGRGSKSFLSPVQVINSQVNALNLQVGQRRNAGFGFLLLENSQKPTTTRETTRRSTFEKPSEIRFEENVPGEVGGNRSSNCSSSNNKKRVIVFRKFCSKSPENNIPPTNENININYGNAMNILDHFAVPLVKPKEKISLSEMITLAKIRTSQNNGVIKRMLHAPSLVIYDIQEESIKCHENLKERIMQWKAQFNTKENKHLIKIFAYFWNSPEGSVSIMMEAAKKGSIQDILDTRASLPENCIQELASSVVSGLNEIHTVLRQPYGELKPSEVWLDADYHPKLSPAISSPLINRSIDNQDNFIPNEADTLAIRHPLGQQSFRELHPSSPKATFSSNKSLPAENFSSDIFDLGYMLLTCALGDLNLYDGTGFYELKNLRSLIESIQSHRRTIKNSCCLLHSEEEIRKYHHEMTLATKAEEQKKTLKNNFNIQPLKQPDSNDLSNGKNRKSFTLLELLSINNRHSDSFIDFLCNCLRIESNGRPQARSLLEHEFVNSSHVSAGPLINFSELALISKKDAELSDSKYEGHLHKVIEAVKIVLLHQEARDKMTKYININLLEHPQSREYRKLNELANELKVPIIKLLTKFRSEILTKAFDR